MKLENETELNKNELNKLEAEFKEKLNKLEDDESDYEREYEFSHCGNYKDTDEIIVAGGGMMNGNAYATVKVIDEFTVLYREYGKNASSEVYRDSELEYDDEGYNFDIIPNARF